MAKPNNLTPSTFCRHCGDKLTFRQVGHRAIPWCSKHGGDFRSPTTAANIVVPTTDGGIVLVYSTGKVSGWSNPGGFGDTNELPEQTAIREALEEIGCEVSISSLLYQYILPDQNVLVFFYLAQPVDVNKVPLAAGDDAEKVQVFYPGEDDLDKLIPAEWEWQRKAAEHWYHNWRQLTESYLYQRALNRMSETRSEEELQVIADDPVWRRYFRTREEKEEYVKQMGKWSNNPFRPSPAAKAFQEAVLEGKITFPLAWLQSVAEQEK